MNGKQRAIAALPDDHKLGMRVAKGGSMCANCEYLATDTTCGNDAFVKWNNGNATLPYPKDEYCCDLWEGGSKRLKMGSKYARK